MASRPGGAISASMIILILVAAAVGAMVAVVLQNVAVLDSRLMALIAGFIATLVASIARYKIIFLGAGKGTDEARIPSVVLTYAAIASIAGSLAAHDIYGMLVDSPSSVFLGALAGLMSAILMAMLMITYHMNPQPTHL